MLHAGVSNKTNTIVLPNHRRRGSRMGGSTSKVTLADERLRLSLDKLGPDDAYRKQMEDWLTASTIRPSHKVPLTPPRKTERKLKLLRAKLAHKMQAKQEQRKPNKKRKRRSKGVPSSASNNNDDAQARLHHD